MTDSRRAHTRMPSTVSSRNDSPTKHASDRAIYAPAAGGCSAPNHPLRKRRSSHARRSSSAPRRRQSSLPHRCKAAPARIDMSAAGTDPAAPQLSRHACRHHFRVAWMRSREALGTFSNQPVNCPHPLEGSPQRPLSYHPGHTMRAEAADEQVRTIRHPRENRPGTCRDRTTVPRLPIAQNL